MDTTPRRDVEACYELLCFLVEIIRMIDQALAPSEDGSDGDVTVSGMREISGQAPSFQR